MRKIWARIGMSLMVSDEEYAKLLERNKEEEIAFEDDDELGKRFAEEGWADGEGYIPDSLFDERGYGADYYPDGAEPKHPLTKRRLINILVSYIDTDLESADPAYVREVLTDQCGCTDDELKEIGVYDWLGFGGDEE